VDVYDVSEQVCVRVCVCVCAAHVRSERESVVRGEHATSDCNRMPTSRVLAAETPRFAHESLEQAQRVGQGVMSRGCGRGGEGWVGVGSGWRVGR
jgi:hypothetical protein